MACSRAYRIDYVESEEEFQARTRDWDPGEASRLERRLVTFLRQVPNLTNFSTHSHIYSKNYLVSFARTDSPGEEVNKWNQEYHIVELFPEAHAILGKANEDWKDFPKEVIEHINNRFPEARYSTREKSPVIHCWKGVEGIQFSEYHEAILR